MFLKKKSLISKKKCMKKFLESVKSKRWMIARVALFAVLVKLTGPLALSALAIVVGETTPEPGAGGAVPPEGGKTPEGGKPGEGGGQPGGAGNGDENIKALHRKLSEKDNQMKTLQAELDKLKAGGNPEFATLIETLQKQVSEMNEELTATRKERQLADLSQKYPDILPELLFGRDEKDIEAIVQKQRAKNQELYGDSRHFTEPTYQTATEVQAAIEAVNADKKMSGEQKAVKVMQLRRILSAFIR